MVCSLAQPGIKQPRIQLVGTLASELQPTLYIRKVPTNDHVLSKHFRHQKHEKEEEQEGEPSWKDRPPYSMYHRQIEEVSIIKKSNQWLDKAVLKDSTEAQIMAAQEQAASTRSIEAMVYHTSQDPNAGCAKMFLRQSNT